MSRDLTARKTHGSGTPIQKRVGALEEEVIQLQDELRQKIAAFSGETALVKAGLDREADQREAADRKTTKMIEEFAVGGLHLETVGVIWLLLGPIATSVPDEVAYFLDRVLPWRGQGRLGTLCLSVVAGQTSLCPADPRLLK